MPKYVNPDFCRANTIAKYPVPQRNVVVQRGLVNVKRWIILKVSPSTLVCIKTAPIARPLASVLIQQYTAGTCRSEQSGYYRQTELSKFHRPFANLESTSISLPFSARLVKA